MKRQLALFITILILCVGSVYLKLRSAEAQTAPVTNGKIAFDSDVDGNYEIYAMNADGSNQVRLTNNSASDLEPSFSPDGSKIAFISDRPLVIPLQNSTQGSQYN